MDYPGSYSEPTVSFQSTLFLQVTERLLGCGVALVHMSPGGILEGPNMGRAQCSTEPYTRWSGIDGSRRNFVHGFARLRAARSMRELSRAKRRTMLPGKRNRRKGHTDSETWTEAVRIAERTSRHALAISPRP